MARTPLSQERIVDAAAAVADRHGLAHLSMRTVGKQLGVEAMSLYHHVASKDALLDALADWVFARLDPPAAGVPWREAMESRAAQQRTVLLAHPWGLGLLESRTAPGPALLRHHDAVLGCLFDAGFGVELAGNAFSLLDAYVFGFVLTETNLPMEQDAGDITADDLVADLPLADGAYPHLARFAHERVAGRDYHYSEEFDVGLALILDGLEQRLTAQAHHR